MHSRLIPVSDLPPTLWNATKRLMHLSPDLVGLWIETLQRNNLLVTAAGPAPQKGPVGGIDKEATDEHLMWRFTGSAARVQLAMLDPQSTMSQVADAFALIFSGGRVALADLPCGSGAAILSILSTLAELRRRELLPRQPLEIVFIGGEISEHARQYTNEGLAAIKDALHEQAIVVESTILRWDVCDALSNTDLIRNIVIRSDSCGARCIVIANFSDYLQRSGKWNDAQVQLQELFRHARHDKSAVIWIEPKTNIVLSEGGFFARIGEWISNKWANFIKMISRESSDDVVATSDAAVQHPLDMNRSFRVNLAVMRFDLHNDA